MEKLLQTIITAKSRQIVSAWEIEQDIKKQLGELQWEKKGGYEALVRGVEELVEKGLLTPIKASGHNGRVPPLSARYRRIRKRVEHPTELFNFRSPLDLSFYVNNLREFERYREILWAIDLYLVKTAKKRPEVWDTINERSFQLTGDEKFWLLHCKAPCSYGGQRLKWRICTVTRYRNLFSTGKQGISPAPVKLSMP